MLPTAIVAGCLVGFWFRWWAVPIVAVGWAVVIAAFVDDVGASDLPAAWVLGAVNAAVGVVPAIALQRVLRRSTAKP
jgi:hypothetical protein